MDAQTALQHLRDALRGQNQAELAAKIGVSEATISRWLAAHSPPKKGLSKLVGWAEQRAASAQVAGHAAIGVAVAGRLSPPLPPVKGESHVTLELSGAATGTVTDPRQSLGYWLGRLEEAGSILEDAAARHGRIRAEMAQALAMPIAKREGMDEVGHRFREGYAPADTAPPETAAK